MDRLSRSLLSLLMVWQLLASVLAHPLDMVPMRDSLANEATSAHCEHMDQAMTTDDHADHSSVGHIGCGSKCHCPCAGTPALSMTLPSMSPAMPDAPLILTEHAAPRAPVLAHLLRPPIS